MSKYPAENDLIDSVCTALGKKILSQSRFKNKILKSEQYEMFKSNI